MFRKVMQVRNVTWATMLRTIYVIMLQGVTTEWRHVDITTQRKRTATSKLLLTSGPITQNSCKLNIFIVLFLVLAEKKGKETSICSGLL